MTDLLVVLTVRIGSERLPGKSVAVVNRRPLMSWLIDRWSKAGDVVVATTQEPSDDLIERIADRHGVECYRHKDPNDVTGRCWAVTKDKPHPYIIRALGDCPWPEVKLVERSVRVMKRLEADQFFWTGDNVFTVYGASEFPWSRRCWAAVNARGTGDEREHPSLYPNRHRGEFKCVYHDPPGDVYFRHPQRMRLEVDWIDDLDMVRRVAEDGPGMLASLADVVRWLDKNDDVAAINRHRTERTGPIASYDGAMHRQWYKLAVNAPVYTWDNEVVEPLGPDSKQARICCENCGHVLGWGQDGALHLRYDTGASVLRGSTVVAEGRTTCPNCGRPRGWRRKL